MRRFCTLLAALVCAAPLAAQSRSSDDSLRASLLRVLTRVDTVRTLRIDSVIVTRTVTRVDTVRDTLRVVVHDTVAPLPPAPPVPIPVPVPAPVLDLPLGTVLPELPRATVDVTMPSRTGRLLHVAAGQSVQAALDSAKAGDVVALATGATWTGNFILPKRGTAGWVVVTSDGPLPPPGTRIDPRVDTLPRLVSANTQPVIQAAPGASGWRLVGLELTLAPTVTLNYGLAFFDGAGASRLILDRVYAHGTATANLQRCVLLNSAASAVVDSYLSDCHWKGLDAQAILAWNSPGPLLIQNDYLEGSGENVMLGGADPRVPGLVPSDVTIRGNHFFKPTSWQGKWTVKNAFEIKNGQRVLFEGNVVDGSWIDAQIGFLVVMQALSQNNTAPWTTIQDVTIRENRFQNATSGINLVSRVAIRIDSTHPGLTPAQPSQRVLIANNTFTNVCGDGAGGCRLFQLLGDLQDVTVAHNTGDPTYAPLFLDYSSSASGVAVQARFTFSDNRLARGSVGVIGNATGEGTTGLARYAPGAVFRGNVLLGTPPTVQRLYPPGFSFAATIGAGADDAAVLAATGRVVVP